MRTFGIVVGVLAVAVVFLVAHERVGDWLQPQWSGWMEQAAKDRARSALAVAEARVKAWIEEKVRLTELASVHVADTDDVQQAVRELATWSESEPSWMVKVGGQTHASGPQPTDATEPLSIADGDLRVRMAADGGYVVGRFAVSGSAFFGPAMPSGVQWAWTAGDDTLVERGAVAEGATRASQQVEGPVPGSRLRVTAGVSPPGLVGPLQQAIRTLGGAAVGIVLLTVLLLPRAPGASAQHKMEARVEAATARPPELHDAQPTQAEPQPEPAPPPVAVQPAEPVPSAVPASVPSAPATSAGFEDPAPSFGSAQASGTDARELMAQAGLPSFAEPARLEHPDRQSPFHRSEQSRFDAVSYHDIQLDQGVPRRTHGPLVRGSQPDPGTEEASQGEGSLPGETTEVSRHTDQAATEDVEPSGQDLALARAAAQPPPEFFASARPAARSETVADAPHGPPTGTISADDLATGDIRTADLQPYDEEHYRKVFNEFVAAKARLGESVASLHFDGFRKKLETSERGLIGKHGCRTVRFMVVTRSDKVTLRPQLVR